MIYRGKLNKNKDILCGKKKEKGLLMQNGLNWSEGIMK